MYKTNADDNSLSQIDHQSSQVKNWASLVSTPIIHGNRFSTLATTDEEEHSDAGDPFVLPRSQRRRLTSAQRRQQPQPSNQQPTVRRPRGPVMIGKSFAPSSSVVAAKRIFKKSVFYIDNVCDSHTVEDIRALVSNMAIDVVSCFEVKPRRQRYNDDVNKKAFRLCICADDRDRLLDGSKWPDSVVIYDWFFKQKTAESRPGDKRPGDKRPRVESEESARTVVGDTCTSEQLPLMDLTENETTILLSTSMTTSSNNYGS